MSEAYPKDFVKPLAKGLEVIGSFNAEHPHQTLSDVARNTGMTRASARRFLRTLTTLGYVEQDGARFSLRPTVLKIGRAYLSMLTLPDVAEPHMRALAALVGEPVSLTVLDGLESVVVVQSQPGRNAENFINVGERVSALATASGRCLLAQLPEEQVEELTRGQSVPRLTATTQRDLSVVREEIRIARRSGYATIDQEFRPHVRSIAMPVYAGINKTPAVLVVSARSRRVTSEELVRDIMPKVQLTAHAIEADYTRTMARRARGTEEGISL